MPRGRRPPDDDVVPIFPEYLHIVPRGTCHRPRLTTNAHKFLQCHPPSPPSLPPAARCCDAAVFCRSLPSPPCPRVLSLNPGMRQRWDERRHLDTTSTVRGPWENVDSHVVSHVSRRSQVSQVSHVAVSRGCLAGGCACCGVWDKLDGGGTRRGAEGGDQIVLLYQHLSPTFFSPLFLQGTIPIGRQEG